MIAKTTDATNELFQVVLQGQGTQIEQVREKQPDLIVAYAGNNDVLGVLTSAPYGKINDETLTPPAQFKANFKKLLDDLSAPYEDGDKKARGQTSLLLLFLMLHRLRYSCRSVRK